MCLPNVLVFHKISLDIGLLFKGNTILDMGLVFPKCWVHHPKSKLHDKHQKSGKNWPTFQENPQQ